MDASSSTYGVLVMRITGSVDDGISSTDSSIMIVCRENELNPHNVSLV